MLPKVVVMIIFENAKMSHARHTLICKLWLCHLKNMYSLVTIELKKVPINTLCETMSDQGGSWLGSVRSMSEPVGGCPMSVSGWPVQNVVTVLIPSPGKQRQETPCVVLLLKDKTTWW